jgi:hypothetical protein
MMFARPILFACLLALTGCATSNVNPPAARPKTGYVDIYKDFPDPVSWEVSRFDVSRRQYQRLYFVVEPLPERILRLGLPPGHHQLRLEILNCVTRGPAMVEVEVKDGMVTPVPTTFMAAGSTQVKDKDILMGSKVKGRRGITISYDESTVYQVSAEAGASVPYEVKEKMPYAR